MGKRLLLIWLGSELVFLLSFAIFKHEPVNLFGFLCYSIQWLLCILSSAIIRYEPNRTNKFIFLNFAFFFSISLFSHVYSFLGSQLVRFYFYQYISFGAYFFLLTFAIAYLCFDALFRDFRVPYKYALTLCIVGGFFVYYFHGYISNPMYLYSTGEARTWKTLNEVRESYLREHEQEPSLETLASLSDLKLWKDGQAIGTLFPEEKLRVVTEFYPYLFGANYTVLLLRPLHMNAIYMGVLCVGFVLLFFGYQYMKDPPQGAYIDKIMFLLLVFCTMEIMHAWSFIKSVELKSLYELFGIGQAASMCLLVLIGVFFALRLRFIRSVKGEFYEHEIVVSPGNVTRWRDALDDLLIAHFFNRKAILGRLFVRSSEDGRS